MQKSEVTIVLMKPRHQHFHYNRTKHSLGLNGFYITYAFLHSLKAKNELIPQASIEKAPKAIDAFQVEHVAN